VHFDVWRTLIFGVLAVAMTQWGPCRAWGAGMQLVELTRYGTAAGNWR
jgi:hypothetical protein